MRQQLVIVALFILCSSCVTCKLKKADKLYQQGIYAAAGELYRELSIQIKPHHKVKKGHIAFRMGECFRKTGYLSRSLTGYRNALRLQHPDSLLVIRLAQVLQTSGMYDEAELHYRKYLSLYPGHPLGRAGLAGCMEAKEWIKNPDRHQIKLLSGINGTRSDYAPQIHPAQSDRLYFLSTRILNKNDKPDPVTGQPFPHIYSSRRNAQGIWDKPVPEEDLLSPEDIAGPFLFSKNTKDLYHTVSLSKGKTKRETTIYRTDISNSQKRRKAFLGDTGKESYHMLHPAISPDGMYLYFASDKPGGYGGTDIYRAFLYRDSLGTWENLGPEINSAGNELFPYWKDEKTFYFSSDGHPGMGGLDIFKAILQSGNKWLISNPGYPLNSSGNDFGIIFETENKGFLSSTRNQPRGYSNIYSFEWQPVQIRIQGHIKDINDAPLPNSRIRIVGENGINQLLETDIHSFYSFFPEEGISYTLLASATGYLNQPVSFHAEPTGEDETYLINFHLIPVTIPILEETIVYDFNSTLLQPESLKTIDQLLEKLIRHPYITLLIKAHADRYGTEEYNDQLSEKRAATVKNYLIKKGIEPERIQTTGAGKRNPKEITPAEAHRHSFLKTGDTLTPEFIESLSPEQQQIADQINRRTEFYILDSDYNLF